jgi:nucleotide-binding universal stress UspA family protein
MRRFRNILLYRGEGDREGPQFERIVQLARGNGARLTLHTVVSEPNRLQRLVDRPQFMNRSLDAVVEARAAELNRLSGLTGDGPTHIGIDRGHVAVEIIRRVLRDEHDLVVIGDRRLPHSPDVRRLLRKCPCPVWVMRPESKLRPTRRHVLAAINPSPDESELNTLIVELASSMVEMFGGVLHIVHAWQMFGDVDTKRKLVAFTPDTPIDELREETRSAHDRALVEFLASIRQFDIERRVHLVHGPPDDVIPQIVHDEHIRLLVMGTVARSGMDGMLTGNTAERVLDEARCSVLAVKPTDFVTPISGLPSSITPTRKEST